MGRPRRRSEGLLVADEEFNRLYDAGLEQSGTPETRTRRARFYNLVNALEFTRGVHGMVAECGTWRGLSAFLLCHRLRREDATFQGERVHIFDSFRGLSEPTAEDRMAPVAGSATPKFAKEPGTYAASADDVRNTLATFPDVSLHEGWIPDCLASAPPGEFRFVHVDVDLYEPTRDAVRFFLPRLADGGALVCDDYESESFPGVAAAIDEFCEETGAPILRLSTSQAVLVAARGAGRAADTRAPARTTPAPVPPSAD